VGDLQHAICQRRFAVVNVSDDAKVAYSLLIHRLRQAPTAIHHLFRSLDANIPDPVRFEKRQTQRRRSPAFARAPPLEKARHPAKRHQLGRSISAELLLQFCATHHGDARAPQEYTPDACRLARQRATTSRVVPPQPPSRPGEAHQVAILFVLSSRSSATRSPTLRKDRCSTRLLKCDMHWTAACHPD